MTETSQQLLRDQLQEERDRVRDQLANLGHDASADSGGAALDFDENFADSGQVTAERGEVEALSGQLREVRRRHVRRVRVLSAAHHRGPPRGDAGGTALHQLRVATSLAQF